jgi:hypothetical protein
MPTLVHLADERDATSIFKNGIKTGKLSSGIYCMPVLPNFYITHQWLRELKSNGVKTYIGVYFKLASDENVFAVKYNQEHKQLTLGEAIKEIMEIDDPLGYELIILRKITSKEIASIKHLPQTLGWRYMPESHDVKPCACEFCLKGTIKGKRTWTRLNSSKSG